ncbi:uncharacterized protein EV420DRAFT_1473527 [Desarmillaria tabescens]|uniref:Uncharacterized protein n=1 Tax=Armillaria tabescens TaxID=1929756 RepID=A0AA39T7U4_ARMTA|nr:uncharacterized protein EV420DRAFT_1473527 [Desarmillaria tabescens]KAK0470471.1 hypothetical protein EV420DRAFT_1473527 [Desarmillaria tabescens]
MVASKLSLAFSDSVVKRALQSLVCTAPVSRRSPPASEKTSIYRARSSEELDLKKCDWVKKDLAHRSVIGLWAIKWIMREVLLRVRRAASIWRCLLRGLVAEPIDRVLVMQSLARGNAVWAM